MTLSPKEKAEELFDKFRTEILSFLGDRMKDQNAKRCALIAVDEILYILNFSLDFRMNKSIKYWQEVKEELLILKNKNNV
jgi:hypothetical protein